MSTPAGSWQTKVVMGAKVKAALHLQTKVKLEACLPAALFSSLGETTCYERKHNCELSLVWVMKRTLRVAKHGLWQGIICDLKLQGTLLAPRRSPLLLPFPTVFRPLVHAKTTGFWWKLWNKWLPPLVDC